MDMTPRALDLQVQVRLDARDLATLAEFFYARGEMRAIKTTSALVRTAVELAVEAIVEQYGARMCETTQEASGTLGRLGLGVRTDARLRHNNNVRDSLESDGAEGVGVQRWYTRSEVQHTRGSVEDIRPQEEGKETDEQRATRVLILQMAERERDAIREKDERVEKMKNLEGLQIAHEMILQPGEVPTPEIVRPLPLELQKEADALTVRSKALKTLPSAKVMEERKEIERLGEELDRRIKEWYTQSEEE